MLRINTSRNGTTWRLELHGAVTGEWIALLEMHWERIVQEAPSAVITVDLSNVVFIDDTGAQLFRRMSGKGVRFDGHGTMNQYVIGKLSGGL